MGRIPEAGREFQDSGLQWLGRIPLGWRRKRLKYLVACVGGGTPTTGNAEFWGGDIPWVSPKDMKTAHIKVTEDYLTELGVESSATSVVEPDAVLVVVRSGILRHSIPVARNSVRVALNQDMKALIPTCDISSKYLYWIIEGHQSQLLPLWSKSGCTVESIDMTSMLNTELPIPTTSEQETIARFLDFKTAQIDALIAKKQTLLDKLAEKRAALVSHAVTKGLDPTVPMKDSGVEWLGEIPAHWSCPPLYSRYTIELGKMLDESRISGKYLVPYLRNVDVQWDEINIRDLPVMDIRPDEFSRYLVEPGDLLVCEGGEVGRAAIVADRSGPLGYQKALHRLRVVDRDRENSRFMFYTLSWASGVGLFLAEGNPNTIPHLTGEKLRRYRFPCPLINEQRLIAEWLDKQCLRIAQQQNMVSGVIERLQEYRSALITNAVTGKIDVRDWQAKQEAA